MNLIVVREFRPDDVAAVAAIEAVASPDPWTPALFEGELSVLPALRHWLVACEAADDRPEVVGFVGMMFVPDDTGAHPEGHVMNVAVRPDRKRQGIARRLLIEAFADALARGVEHLTLEVRVSNDPARSLYHQLGFAPVGLRPRYYPDGEDALILWAHDIQTVEFRRRLGLREAS
ncbi:MAG: ribosomal protein S18-alanine N-acetyltransferase [Actinomycetota bacterium]|nr:ribosomal protein S18-alanine N-acetyltransferase [Actinomycetota bacterium]